MLVETFNKKENFLETINKKKKDLLNQLDCFGFYKNHKNRDTISVRSVFFFDRIVISILAVFTDLKKKM